MTLESPYIVENLKLRHRIDELEAEMDEYRRLMTVIDQDATELAMRTPLSYALARAVVFLARGQPVTRDQFLTFLGTEHSLSDRNIDSQIKRIRKLAPQVKISTIYGYGYCIMPDDLPAVRRFIKGTWQ